MSQLRRMSFQENSLFFCVLDASVLECYSPTGLSSWLFFQFPGQLVQFDHLGIEIFSELLEFDQFIYNIGSWYRSSFWCMVVWEMALMIVYSGNNICLVSKQWWHSMYWIRLWSNNKRINSQDCKFPRNIPFFRVLFGKFGIWLKS